MSDFSKIYNDGSLKTLDSFAPLDMLERLIALVDKKEKNALFLQEMIIGTYRKLYNGTSVEKPFVKVVGQRLLLAHNLTDLHAGMNELLDDAKRSGGSSEEKGSAAGVFIFIEMLISAVISKISAASLEAEKADKTGGTTAPLDAATANSTTSAL